MPLDMTAQQLAGLAREVDNWDGDVALVMLKAGPVRDIHVRLNDKMDNTLDEFTLRIDGERFEGDFFELESWRWDVKPA